jgi:glycerophosphoryl diester phosphodiesterase
MSITETGLAALDQSNSNADDLALAQRHAPRIRFDVREPFFPSVVGYTVFREGAPSPSFPRQIELNGAATVIEYAVWWDWDIQHLYELEHIWVWLDADEKLIGGEASWHGGYHVMSDERGMTPSENGHLVVHSEPGKHAFAPSPKWLLEREPITRRSCGANAGRMAVHVTPLFEGIIRSRTPLANRAVHSYLECLAFEPSFDFSNVFELEKVAFVPWPQLNDWIPGQVARWADHLVQVLPTNKQHLYNIAHRGASAYAPENSLQAFYKAAEMGSDLVEIDVRFTKDNVPVVSHDDTLRRVYGVDGVISDVTLEQLRALTPPGMDVIPTFDDVAEVCKNLQMGIYLDIKEVNAETMVKVFETLKRMNMMNYCVAGSTRPDWLADIKAAEPRMFTSILYNSIYVDPIPLARSINCDYVHPCWERRAPEPHRLLLPDMVERIHDAGLGIVCWHEERPSEIAALRALGVDMICSDTPDRLAVHQVICD